MFVTIDTRIVGLFHDDGIYVATAKSLAEAGGYRIQSLPSEPPQTKYPPLYSLAIAAVWAAWPDFPHNVIALKGLNIVFAVILILGFRQLIETALPEAAWTESTALVLALASAPGLWSFVNYTMSDVLFASFVMLCTVVLPLATGRRWTRGLFGAVLLSLAVLTRSIGIAIVLAVALDAAWARQLRSRRVVLLAPTLVFVAWWAWGTRSVLAHDPILGYYVGYERSALGYLSTAPGTSLEIVVGNLVLAAQGFPLVVAPLLHWLWPLFLPLAVYGLGVLWCRGIRLPALLVAVYLAVTLLHPFAPHRYLLPLVPFWYLSIAAGAHSVVRLAGAARATVFDPAQVLVLVLITMLLAGNVAWARMALWSNNGGVVGWYGLNLGYSWQGFEETFNWIRTNTPPSARLGTMFDPMYFLYTGRQGVRPWFHQPETYFYPVGDARPDVGEPARILEALRTLGVDYIVLDPPAGYAEGQAGMRMLRELLSLSEARASVVFRSSDGLHEVHRLGEARLTGTIGPEFDGWVR